MYEVDNDVTQKIVDDLLDMPGAPTTPRKRAEGNALVYITLGDKFFDPDIGHGVAEVQDVETSCFSDTDGLLNEFALMYSLKDKFPISYCVFKQISSNMPRFRQ